MSEVCAGAPSARFGPVTVYFGDKNGKYPDGNQVTVRGRDSLAVFDSPPVANRIGSGFDDADLVIQGHIHEDHIAGLHRLPGVPVHVHQDDVLALRSWAGLARHYGVGAAVLPKLRAKIEREYNYVERADALGFADGAQWSLGGGVTVRAQHLPGHTAGHCALIVEPGAIAFIGDIDLSGFGPYYGDATSSLAQFRESLRRIALLPAKIWITSHHRGVYTDAAKFSADLAAYTDKLAHREQRLIDMLSAGPRSLDELVAQRLLYPADYQEIWVEDAERRSISQHLDELNQHGRVATDGDGRYRLV